MVEYNISKTRELMKTKITLTLAAAFLFVGCSSSPEDAVYGMYDALGNGDLSGLQETATESTLGLLSMASMMQCQANKNDFDSEEELVSECLEQAFGDISISDVEILEQTETSAKALVTSSNNGKESKEKIDLRKVDDTWKVHISK